MIINLIAISLSILTCVVFLILGILIGLSRESFGVPSNKKSSLFDSSQINKMAKITIDDTKFVTEIKTDGMNKGYSSLGDVRQSDEDISDSINKLQNMKKS